MTGASAVCRILPLRPVAASRWGHLGGGAYSSVFLPLPLLQQEHYATLLRCINNQGRTVVPTTTKGIFTDHCGPAVDSSVLMSAFLEAGVTMALYIEYGCTYSHGIQGLVLLSSGLALTRGWNLFFVCSETAFAADSQHAITLKCSGYKCRLGPRCLLRMAQC